MSCGAYICLRFKKKCILFIYFLQNISFGLGAASKSNIVLGHTTPNYLESCVVMPVYGRRICALLLTVCKYLKETDVMCVGYNYG